MYVILPFVLQYVYKIRHNRLSRFTLFLLVTIRSFVIEVRRFLFLVVK